MYCDQIEQNFIWESNKNLDEHTVMKMLCGRDKSIVILFIGVCLDSFNLNKLIRFFVFLTLERPQTLLKCYKNTLHEKFYLKRFNLFLHDMLLTYFMKKFLVKIEIFSFGSSQNDRYMVVLVLKISFKFIFNNMKLYFWFDSFVNGWQECMWDFFLNIVNYYIDNMRFINWVSRNY